MKKLNMAAALAIPAFALATPHGVGQETRETAKQAMRNVEAKEMDSTFTMAAPYAQKLLDEVLAQHPEVLLIAMHVTPPGHAKNVIIASNFGRIGKLADEDDMRVVDTRNSNLGVEPSGKHFEAELPLFDKAGRLVGALAIVYSYKPDDDKAALSLTSSKICDAMRARIKSRDQLFGTTP